MAVNTTLAGLSQTAASNGPDGSSDAPSTLDDAIRYALSFIAQLRDGNGISNGLGILGQCQLSKSGANLILLPFNGNGLFINGKVCTVPAAGVTLAPTSLSVGTVYNIYAVATAGVVTSLEASTTARATDATYLNQIKSGDASRALVGKARIITGPAWADTDAQRFVISWFNQRPKRIYSTNGSAPATTSGTPVSLVTFMEFLAWGDSCVPACFVGNVSNNTTNGQCLTALGYDSSTVFAHSPANYQAYTGGSNGSAAGGTTLIPNEGYHFVYTLGSVTAGTGTWAAGIEMSGVIQG